MLTQLIEFNSPGLDDSGLGLELEEKRLDMDIQRQFYERRIQSTD
jgi:hypothetical protein